MRLTTRSLLVLGSMIALALIGGCASVGAYSGAPLKTIDGPEDPELLAGTHGTLVVLDRDDDTHLRVIRLPSVDEREIELPVHALSISGPDDQGRVAYLTRTDEIGLRRYTVRVLSLASASDEPIFERSCAPDVSAQIALSPSSGLVAFTSAPDDYESSGSSPWLLELIDVTTKTVKHVSGSMPMRTPCWFPDGRRVAFFEWRADDRTTITSIADARSGTRRVARETQGQEWLVGVSADGSTLLFALAGVDGRARRADAETGRTRPDDLELPGLHRAEIVGDLGDGKYLYGALPTSGVAQEARRGYVWPHDVKLADARTRKFVTVVPQMWGVASYGAFDREP
jgi:hypothetical protein